MSWWLLPCTSAGPWGRPSRLPRTGHYRSVVSRWLPPWQRHPGNRYVGRVHVLPTFPRRSGIACLCKLPAEAVHLVQRVPVSACKLELVHGSSQQVLLHEASTHQPVDIRLRSVGRHCAGGHEGLQKRECLFRVADSQFGHRQGVTEGGRWTGRERRPLGVCR